jgi:hypothetical protein
MAWCNGVGLMVSCARFGECDVLPDDVWYWGEGASVVCTEVSDVVMTFSLSFSVLF